MITKLEIFLSAQKFALETLDTSVAFDLASMSVAQFNSEKLHKADFPFWNEQMHAARQKMLSLRTQKSAAPEPAPRPEVKTAKKG